MQGARDERRSSHIRRQHVRRRLCHHVNHIVSQLERGTGWSCASIVRPGGWLGIVHWARALKRLPLPTDSPDAPKLTALLSAHELRAALKARRCEVKEDERLDASSPLPPPESFMDTLDPIYSGFPTYRSLGETMRGELRVLLTREARRWVEEDVPAGSHS